MTDQPRKTDDPQRSHEAEGRAPRAEAPAPGRKPPLPASGDATGLEPPAASQLDPATEEELWAGRASWASLIPSLIGWLALTLILTIGAALLTEDSTAWVVVLILCAALLLVLLARAAWRIWSTSYRLTTQRLFVRRGILTQTVDQTELLRVDDVRMRQTLIQRLLGIGQVEVIASDRSDAELVLRDIPAPEAVAEHVRRHTRTLQRRTLFMEQL